MALRTTLHTSQMGPDNVLKKVETKLIQGPVLHRPALGEVGNCAISLRGSKAPLKLSEITKRPSIVPKLRQSKMAPPAKRMKYDASFKLKVVRFAKASNDSAAAREFGVNEKQDREWKKAEEKLDIPRTKCALRRGKQQWPELEEKLFEWVDENRESGYVITGNAICIDSSEVDLCSFSSDKENAKKSRDPVENVEEQMDVEEVAKVKELSIAFSTQCLGVEDIDAEDGRNPQLVSEYVKDIYKHLRLLEEGNKVRRHYLDGQQITGRMRSILIDWLVQVHIRFTLLQETLYLTVTIIDRYLQSERNLPRTKLQLVGVTAMFIASKYEEMYCPEIGDFAYITDKAYSKAEIRQMEVAILKKLDFNVDSAQHSLAKYLMELCLPEYSMCHYKPSMIAGAALWLSLRVLDGSPWNETLVYYSCYTEQELMPVVCKIAALVIKSSVRQKYKASKHMKISDIPQLKSRIVTKLAEKGSLL
ncbi:G2/mitotic-specific cyclin-B-like 2 [Homarus americanus]|uniref:G2/mitotic-specific cyclin-B-like 2 n=1 Tax=Homarus americanus TaxID=6706 RepID=A0A8J5JKD6_HOMAM|nr:G2/mitotic-specific cyclin-B-like 2 [Homarus americanus]